MTCLKMTNKAKFVFHILLFFVFFGELTFGFDCDIDNTQVEEDVIEKRTVFPWLGILKVFLREVTSLRIAVTGLVLIKDNFAIANANDIAKIPEHILKNRTLVMFVFDFDEPWHCKVKDFKTHPEYYVLTYNTIALVQLYLVNENDVLPKPICWPYKHYNPGADIYVIGYTYDNDLIEKTIYKVQHLEKPLCDEFYIRANLSEDMLIPMRYQCAYALNVKENCVWDNGMLVASNSTGYWVVLGLTVQGPGCAAPIRYIDINAYLKWLYTNLPGDKTQHKVFADRPVIDNVPIHTLFQEGKALRMGVDDILGTPDAEQPDHVGSPFFSSFYPPNYGNPLLNPDAQWMLLGTFLNESEKYAEFAPWRGDCSKKHVLAYRESTIIRDSQLLNREGRYYVRVSDHNLEVLNCIKLSIKGTKFGPAKAWTEFKVYVMHEEQPRFTLKKIFMPRLKVNWTTAKPFETTTPLGYLRQAENTEKAKIDLTHFIGSVYLTPPPLERLNQTINLLAFFKFEGRAELKVEVYGIKKYPELVFDKFQYPGSPPTEKRLNSSGSSSPWRRFEEKIQKPRILNELESTFWSGESFIIVDKQKTETKTVESKKVVKNKSRNKTDYLHWTKKQLEDILKNMFTKHQVTTEYTKKTPDMDYEKTTELNDIQYDMERTPPTRAWLLNLNEYDQTEQNNLNKNEFDEIIQTELLPTELQTELTPTELISESYKDLLQYDMSSNSLSRCCICKPMVLLCFVVYYCNNKLF